MTATATGPQPLPLGEPATGGALRSVNFFNGRLLTGDDLSSEQTVDARRLARLGTTVGAGVASGLWVEEATGLSTPAKPVLSVTGGVALAPSGRALELPQRADVAFYRNGPTADSEPGGLFADCQPHAPGTYTTGAGVYLLTIGPGSKGEGLAAVSGLGNEPAPCNVAFEVEGVSFRSIRLALPRATLDATDLLRSAVARLAFGEDDVSALARDPFGSAVASYGLIDGLRADGTLAPDELPLALVGWTTTGGIEWVDRWAVRRRVTAPDGSSPLPLLTAGRRPAEGEARFLQFQEQMEDLRFDVAPEDVRASELFGALPPAGLLPLAAAGMRGFDFRNFFDGSTVRGPVLMAGARLIDVVRESFSYPPIDMPSQEVIWLYLTRENVVTPESGPQPAPFVLFANGHIPYRADAAFDLAYWNFASYAEVG